MKTAQLATFCFACLLGILPVTASAASYVVSADGAEVTDQKTGLTWRRCSEGMTWNGATCAGSPTAFTHEAALQHAAAQANSTGVAWRLPNVKELSSIAGKSHTSPAIDATAFPATPSNAFWSSSPYAGVSNYAWSVYFGYGHVVNSNYRDDSSYVRLVRAGQSFGSLARPIDATAPADGALSATSGTGQISLGWSGFSDTGSGIAGYKVVSSNLASPANCTASTPIYSGAATQFTDTAVVNGATYFYRVCAVDNAGNVSAGAVASATPQQTITPTTGSIRVSIVPQAAANLGAQWRLTGETAWRNSGSAAYGAPLGSYTVEFSPVAGWTTPPTLPVTIGAANPDIWVDSGAYGSPVTVNAPSNLRAAPASGGGISFTWTDNSSNESVFMLEQKVGAGAYGTVANLNPDSTSYLYAPAAGFAAGQQHCYRMRAYDGLLTYSGYSNEVCITPSQTPVDAVCAASSPLTVSTAKVAMGVSHALSLRTDGTVWAWGSNLYGQLGNGMTTDSAAPVQVQGMSGVTAIAAGLNRSIALKSDGTVWVWGVYTTALQANGMSTGSGTPMQVNGLSGIVAIAAGSEHNLALKSDGTVWAWGSNSSGQLGNGDSADSDAPVQVTGLTGVSAIAAGHLHSVALKTDGTVWAWGANGDGSLGNGSVATQQATPSQVAGLSGVSALAAGDGYSVALKADGTVWAWGSNVYGQMGTGVATPNAPQTAPAQVTGVSGIVALAAGDGHVLAVQADGGVIGWGYNLTGQVGDGTTLTPRPVTPVSGLSSVIQVAAAWNQSIALKASGHVCAWGSNASGQLGSGGTTDRAYPAVASEAGGAGYLNLSNAPPPPPAPVVSISTTPLSFGNQNVGATSAAQSVSLRNISNTALSISGIVASGDFGVSHNCGASLAAGASCAINVTFAPAAAGARSGTLTISSNATGNPHSIALSGTGLVSVPGTPTGVNATAGNAQATVTIAAPASDGGAAIDGYTVTSNPAGGVDSNAGSISLSHVIMGLTNGTAYTFTVTAHNSAGTSVASAASNAVTPVAPVSTFTISTTAGINGNITPASQIVTSGNTTSFTVTPSSGYTASVSGCGGSLSGGTYTTGAITANCTVSAVFTQIISPIQTNLVAGWNLLGNSVDASLDVVATLGDANKVTTVWKWVPATSKWAFYTPLQTDGGAAYAVTKGYDALTTINGGEGFWVNAKTAFTVSLPTGTSISANYFQDQINAAQNKLLKGWNLIAIGETKTPSQFNVALSATSAQGTIPQNVTTLWAWDSGLSGWYFYAPSLESNGTLVNYITSKSYLDFTARGKMLGQGVGFWVNKP